jgi:hypothetical protein
VKQDYCSLQCDIGYSASGTRYSSELTAGQDQIFLVLCNDEGTVNEALFLSLAEAGTEFSARNLNCQPDECISTSDEEEAKKDTHILCENGLIASGKTGNCQCTAEDPTPQTTQATTVTTTTSSAVSLRSEYAQMLLFSLSFLV